jgi:HEAT repeat protein
MAERAPASLRFWQAWALVGALATAISGARLAHLPRASTPPAPRASIPAKVPSAPRVEVELAPSAPAQDRLLAQLQRAETAAEECELLGQVPSSEDPDATYAITEVLERTSFRSVRACAAEALGREPTPPAQSWLIDLIEDPDPNVNKSALEALVAHGDSSAQAAVIEATRSDDSDTRVNAVIALLAAGHAEAFSAAVQLLGQVDDHDTLLALADALGSSHDSRALPVLSTLVRDADFETHVHAISALGELGDAKAAPLLSTLLEVGSAEEFQAAAQALAKLSPKTILGQLQTLVHSPNADRRDDAMSAIAQLDLPGVLPILAQALRGDEVPLIQSALQRLSQTPEASLEPEITALLDRGDESIHRFAIHALARLETPSARSTLQKLADSETLGPWVRDELGRAPAASDEARAQRIRNVAEGSTSALHALARDPSAAAQDAVFGYFSGSGEHSRQLEEIVDLAPMNTVQRLVQLESSAGLAERQALTQGLAEREDPKFVEALRAAMHDEDNEVRHRALRGLVELGDTEALEALTRLVTATDVSERGFAAQLLGAHPDPSALSQLETLASDRETEVLTAALGSLQTSSPELAARLAQRAFQAASSQDKPALLSTLGDLPSALKLPLFDLALQDSEEEVVLTAVQSLGEGPGSAERLLRLVTDADRSQTVRATAAEALRALGGPLAQGNRALLDSLAPAEPAEAYTCSTHYR